MVLVVVVVVMVVAVVAVAVVVAVVGSVEAIAVQVGPHQELGVVGWRRVRRPQRDHRQN